MTKKIIRSGHTKFVVFGQHQRESLKVTEKIGRRQSKQRKQITQKNSWLLTSLDS